jgi:hypothetical protein
MPSIIFLLGGFAFIEAFSGNLNEEYPLAANRLSCIVDQCEESPQNKQIITSWIESQRRSLLKFEALRKNNEGSIRNRIEESMPVYEAHYVIEEIKKRVLEQHGLLDIG